MQEGTATSALEHLLLLVHVSHSKSCWMRSADGRISEPDQVDEESGEVVVVKAAQDSKSAASTLCARIHSCARDHHAVIGPGPTG
jgi:hypothetical protein